MPTHFWLYGIWNMNHRQDHPHKKNNNPSYSFHSPDFCFFLLPRIPSQLQAASCGVLEAVAIQGPQRVA